MTTVKTEDFPCWCGNNEWEIQFSIPGYRLLNCTNCGVFRNDPPPVSSSDESADFYTDYYSDKEEYGSVKNTKTKNSRYWKVAYKEKIETDKNGTVLDLGCGDGDLCGELKADGWGNVIGLDVSKKRIADAKKKYQNIQFYDTSIEDTGINKNSLDLIIMDNVIEHIPSPCEFIKSLISYLKPKGKLIMITPNMHSGNFRLLGKRWTPELCPHAHVYLFTVPSINVMAQLAGYNVTASGSFHLKLAGISKLLARLTKDGARVFLWKLMQESGGMYSRVIGQGEMLFNIVEKK